jgi:DNA-binding beta-propeller fold protein YncE
MWGNFGQAEDAYALWGPRDVAVDEAGRVYITDTGNKRVVVYDENGVFISEFGGVGFSPGEFDEPVGIDIGPNGNVHVADTWNQRVQLFDEYGDDDYQVIRYWDVVGWFGQSLENKPFLAVGPDLHIFATDPEGYRVLEFLVNGELVRYWGDYGTGPNNFGLAGAVAVDGEGGVWVTDTGNSRLMHFTLPQGD